MRAVKGSLGHSFEEMYRELEELSSTHAVETTPAASLNAEVSQELSSSLLWPVSLVPHISRVTVQGRAYDIEVRPSSPTADEFHPNAKKKECPGFVSAAKSFTRTRVICHSDSHRCRPNLIENPHQLIYLHRGKESIWTFRCKVGERRLVER